MTTAPAATAALTATTPPATTAPAAGSHTQPAPVAQPVPAAAPSPESKPGDWLAGLSPEAQALAKAKGWKDPAAAIDSYGSLEKLFGQDRAGRTIALPKDGEDKAAWDAIYDRLGRPKDAGGYEIPVPEGGDKSFAATAAGKFHELGLTKTQGAALAEWWNGQATQLQQQQAAASLARSQQEHDALVAEWGTQAPANLETARRGARMFGFSGDELTAIEGVIGTRAMLERFFAVGQGLGEDKVPGDALPGATVKEQAQAKIERLRGDPQFMARYTSPNPQIRAAAIAEMEAAYKALG